MFSMAGARLDIVPPGMILKFWPVVQKFVRKGCARSNGELNEKDLKKSLARHEQTLWLVSEDTVPLAVIITRNEAWLCGKVCRIVLIAGTRMKDWEHLEEEFHAILKNDGVMKVVQQGRSGWLRAQMSRGYRRTAVVMEREL